jgi:hypothetical protein
MRQSKGLKNKQPAFPAGCSTMYRERLTSDALHVNGVQTLATVLGVERYAVVFADLINEASGVNENVVAARSRLDEAEALLCVEELHNAFLHKKELKNKE